ncbi:MAG: transaldolase family protein [Chloroflexota bacterium]
MTALTDPTTALPLADTPLGRTVALGPTDIWNDSCAVDELEYAISYGAVGATANPTIVVDVWKKDPAGNRAMARQLAAEHPAASEDELAWMMVEAFSVRAAPLLMPTFERFRGRKGRLSVQTSPTYYRSTEKLVAQARHFATLAPNIVVKIPATKAGIAAMEEATYHGVSINCTVSFSVAQAVAAAEAVERGIARREAEGLPTEEMGPVITIMVGRVEDWLNVLIARDNIIVDPDLTAWSGVAVFKRAIEIFDARGYRARILAAAIRHHLHWSEFIGGECILTLPAVWQRRFNGSDIPVEKRSHIPVDPAKVAALEAHFPDFTRAYDPDGLSIDEFDAWPPTVRTLRGFTASWHELLALVAEALLPDPDKKA